MLKNTRTLDVMAESDRTIDDVMSRATSSKPDVSKNDSVYEYTYNDGMVHVHHKYTIRAINHYRAQKIIVEKTMTVGGSAVNSRVFEIRLTRSEAVLLRKLLGKMNGNLQIRNNPSYVISRCVDSDVCFRDYGFDMIQIRTLIYKLRAKVMPACNFWSFPHTVVTHKTTGQKSGGYAMAILKKPNTTVSTDRRMSNPARIKTPIF